MVMFCFGNVTTKKEVILDKLSTGRTREVILNKLGASRTIDYMFKEVNYGNRS
jgi:hypothetical protein